MHVTKRSFGRGVDTLPSGYGAEFEPSGTLYYLIGAAPALKEWVLCATGSRAQYPGGYGFSAATCECKGPLVRSSPGAHSAEPCALAMLLLCCFVRSFAEKLNLLFSYEMSVDHLLQV